MYKYPFTAIVGQTKVKEALILNAINPKIKGVLISGEKGTGKSLMVRSLANLLEDKRVIELPLNITEDQLVGSVDIGNAIKTGNKVLEYGLLKKAHNNFLYIDEVNLLSEHIINIILETSSQEHNFIEREGISYDHSSNFMLIGSMNPEEGFLRSQFLDRFGLYVETVGEKDLLLRKEIMKRVLEYEKDPKKFQKLWEEKEKALRLKIQNSIKRLKNIKVERAHLEIIVTLVMASNCQGHRAELALLETAKAMAALRNEELNYEIIKDSAYYVLPHCMREDLEIELEEVEDAEELDHENEEEKNQDLLDELDDIDLNDELSDEDSGITEEELLEDIEELKEDFKLDIDFKEKMENEGTGKRAKVKTNSRKGRYVKYKIPKGKAKDIAFNATFRIAAINQWGREKQEGLAISIKTEDLREKVRENQTGANLLFLVDASGSMGARKRMGAVKGAVLSLLTDAYQKRDNIGIIVFRNKKADILLNTTRSVDLAEKCLRDISTGGETPLAAGLEKAYRLMTMEKIKDPEILQYLILVSDCKGNVPLYTNDSMEDAYYIGEKIKNAGINSLILDTKSGFMQFDFGERLADRMNSEYVKLTKVTKGEIESNIKDLINKKY